MVSGMPDEFVFDVIENWKFGINSLGAEKLCNESLKKIRGSVSWGRRWGLVPGWLRKPILKSHRPEMKRLNQHRESGYDKKEMSMSDALRKTWALPGVWWTQEIVISYGCASCILNFTELPYQPCLFLAQARSYVWLGFQSCLGSNPPGPPFVENFSYITLPYFD